MNDPVDLLAELVAIDSVNPGLVPGAAGEAAIVSALQSRLAAAGFETETVLPDDHQDRPSLLAWSRGIGPAVVFSGHVDTVGVQGMPAPFEPRIDGTRMYGRGTADMKGGLAGQVCAAERIAAAGGSVVLALAADEENVSLGTETLIARLELTGLEPVLAVVGEPTALDRCVSLRGFAVFEVTLTGRAAHSSLPAEGVNAVAQLGRLLVALEQADADLAGGGSWAVTVASGGSAPFSVPAHARAVVERRLTPSEQLGDVAAELARILQPLRSADPTFAAMIAYLVGRDPWRLDETGPAAEFANELEQALGDVPGRTGRPFSAPYWMEAPLWQAAGVPAVVCGPSGGGIHATEEWVDLRQVRRYADGLVAAHRALVAGRRAD